MKRIIILAIMLGILIVNPLGVSALTFYLDKVNDNNTGTSGPWATVTLTDSTFDGKDSVHFVVDPIEDSFINIGTNFGLQTFYFNESTSFGNLLAVDNFNNIEWHYEYSESNAGGGFGKFEFITDGDGNSRLNPLSFDVYATTGQDVSVVDFSNTLSDQGYLFAAHIADYANGSSAKFATDGSTPVPEPSTLLMLGAGLLGLGLYGRRRVQK